MRLRMLVVTTNNNNYVYYVNIVREHITLVTVLRARKQKRYCFIGKKIKIYITMLLKCDHYDTTLTVRGDVICTIFYYARALPTNNI
jgi:hypothetical protein